MTDSVVPARPKTAPAPRRPAALRRTARRTSPVATMSFHRSPRSRSSGRSGRYARTHTAWTAPGVTVDDLLVSLADKVWKGKRVTDLEELVIGHLTAASGQEPWEAFLVLDDIVGRIAAGADARLAFQASHSLPAPPSDRPR